MCYEQSAMWFNVRQRIGIAYNADRFVAVSTIADVAGKCIGKRQPLMIMEFVIVVCHRGEFFYGNFLLKMFLWSLRTVSV